MGFVVLCTGWGETFSIRAGVPNVSSPREPIFFFVSFAVLFFVFVLFSILSLSVHGSDWLANSLCEETFVLLGEGRWLGYRCSVEVPASCIKCLMPRKHSAQAIPVPTHIRAPDFRKAKSSVSQCVNQKVLFWFEIVGCSYGSITFNPSGVAVERKAIIDSPKKRYAIHNTSISLILLCEAPHPRRLHSSACG